LGFKKEVKDNIRPEENWNDVCFWGKKSRELFARKGWPRTAPEVARNKRLYGVLSHGTKFS
jgi:hypothetical protein